MILSNNNNNNNIIIIIIIIIIVVIFSKEDYFEDYFVLEIFFKYRAGEKHFFFLNCVFFFNL